MAGERKFIVTILGNVDGAVTAFKKLGKEGQQTIEQIQSVGNTIGAGFDVVKKAAFIAVGAFTAVAGAATAAAAAPATAVNPPIAMNAPFFTKSNAPPNAAPILPTFSKES